MSFLHCNLALNIGLTYLNTLLFIEGQRNGWNYVSCRLQCPLAGRKHKILTIVCYSQDF